MAITISEVENGVLTLSMHRPEKKNALNLLMYQQLSLALNQAAQDEAIAVVVLRGTEDCFTSGNDLSDFLSAGALDREHPVVMFLYTIASFPKPILAAVAGLAIGIGTTVLLHCDLVYATADCRFQMPFTLLGLCPEAASSLLLPQLAGYQRAAQYLLLAEPFTTAQAQHFGLVNETLSKETLFTHVSHKAEQLAALPTAAVQRSKALMKAPMQHSVLQTLANELVDFQTLLASESCQQKLQAFFSK